VVARPAAAFEVYVPGALSEDCVVRALHWIAANIRRLSHPEDIPPIDPFARAVKHTIGKRFHHDSPAPSLPDRQMSEAGSGRDSTADCPWSSQAF
jgi:hypothetical protein